MRSDKAASKTAPRHRETHPLSTGHARKASPGSSTPQEPHVRDRETRHSARPAMLSAERTEQAPPPQDAPEHSGSIPLANASCRRRSPPRSFQPCPFRPSPPVSNDATRSRAKRCGRVMRFQNRKEPRGVLPWGSISAEGQGCGRKKIPAGKTFCRGRHDTPRRGSASPSVPFHAGRHGSGRRFRQQSAGRSFRRERVLKGSATPPPSSGRRGFCGSGFRTGSFPARRPSGNSSSVPGTALPARRAGRRWCSR